MAPVTIPPIYDPPLSAAVIDYARGVASKLLADHGDYYSDDYPRLYRVVRAAMNRRAECDPEHPSLDDESISAGIVEAINEKGS